MRHRALAVGALLFAAASSVPGAEGGFDLRRLGCLAPTKEMNTASFLTYLQEETAAPSPDRESFGGRITHPYILAQIVLWGAQAPTDVDHLRKAARSSGPGEYRECIQLTLALLGDKAQVPFAISYMRYRARSQYLRERAVLAFLRHPDGRAIPALAEMLQDETWVTGGRVGPPTKYYVIRMEARAALKAMIKRPWHVGAEVRQRMQNLVVSAPYDPERDGPPPP